MALATVRLDAQSVKRVERAVQDFERQGRFAFALTLNDIGFAFVAALQSALRGHLTVRSAASHEFLARRIQFRPEDRAKVSSAGDRLTATVKIRDPESHLGKGRLTLLATLATTTGGEKVRGPLRYLAIPTRALRPSPATIVPRSMYPVNLGVAPRRDIGGGVVPGHIATRTRKKARVTKGQKLGIHRTAKGRYQIFGKDRTFAIDPRYHPRVKSQKSYGVYQRFGPGEQGVRKLFIYRAAVRVPPRLPAQKIMTALVKRLFRDRYERNLQHALRTAR
jgi:hypothetical protein